MKKVLYGFTALSATAIDLSAKARRHTEFYDKSDMVRTDAKIGKHIVHNNNKINIYLCIKN
jgi:hypothetical protein